MKNVNKREKNLKFFNTLNNEISSIKSYIHIFNQPTTDTKINLKNKGRI